MIEIQNENTLKSALADGINLFLGSGFSVLARNASNQSMPVGNVLLEEVVREFGLMDFEGLSLAQVCAVIESTQRDRLRSFFQKRFTVAVFDDRYRILDEINIKTILTTNVDDLISKIYTSSKRHYMKDVMIQGPSFHDRFAVDVIALHGSVAHPGETLSFSPIDLAGAFSSDPDKWHFLTARLQQHPTLFWGYNLSDAGVLQALNPASVRGRPHQIKWIVLGDRHPPAISYFEALGFNIIISDTVEVLEWLALASPSSSGKSVGVATRPTKELFPSEAIPDIGSIPVRPLQDFYSGAAPTWHDIFTGRIHRTTQFAKVLDVANSRRNAMVIGIPACGKTTVMMHVAAQVNFAGHKLVVGPMTRQRAELILNRLDGGAALIFMDDATDNVEALEVFLGAKGVQVVGFERDYYL